MGRQRGASVRLRPSVCRVLWFGLKGCWIGGAQAALPREEVAGSGSGADGCRGSRWEIGLSG